MILPDPCPGQAPPANSYGDNPAQAPHVWWCEPCQTGEGPFTSEALAAAGADTHAATRHPSVRVDLIVRPLGAPGPGDQTTARRTAVCTAGGVRG